MESPLWCPLPSPPAVVMLCVLMTERNGAAELWEAARGRDPRGRPGHASINGLLTGMSLCAWTQRRLQLSWVDRVLQGLDDPVLGYLHVRRHGPPVVIREGRRSRLDARGRPIGKPKRLDSNVAEPLHRLSVAMAAPLEWSPFAASKKSPGERQDAWRL